MNTFKVTIEIDTAELPELIDAFIMDVEARRAGSVPEDVAEYNELIVDAGNYRLEVIKDELGVFIARRAGFTACEDYVVQDFID